MTHFLDHTTTTATTPVTLYESNGSGVAINDLDRDGDLDVVLANLHGSNTILWNQGGLAFSAQRLSHGDSRAVNTVDVDGDGWLDIVFTRRFDKPTYWHNTGKDGDARFSQGELPDVHNPFYSIDWADMDGDDDLDLVAASYDTELRKVEGSIFDYRGGGVGVFIYANEGQGFVSQQLADEADALAIALPDLNGDGRLDILIGNDFDRPDYIWIRTDDGWLADQPFTAMTENTMSFDIGDVDNNGSPEIFATDMKPYLQDEETMAAWQPLMSMMSHPGSPDDPQVIENVIQVLSTSGRFENQAGQRTVTATGWSWSSKFGDLDNDGFLDIYVVNGMMADGLLAHLPGSELVEHNRALHNQGNGYFAPAPLGWNLGSPASGRGMSMADLDSDGDLDIVVNNLLSPATLFENRLCGGAGFEVDLRQPGSRNPYAIGAQLLLHAGDQTFYRSVTAAGGYLSGNPTRIHFGVPLEASLKSLDITWPDGTTSTIYTLAPQTRITVTRNEQLGMHP